MSNCPYFTSRNQIIDWINDLLITHLTKIEQLGSGNIYCQLLDAAFPQKVPLNKVKWQAYLQIDFLYNFKILQAAFDRLGINKHVDIQKLAKAKYQDNLEFAQWMRWYLSPKIKENQVYNALSRRNHAQINLLFSDKKHFDLRQTVVYKEHDNRELREIKESYMVNSISIQGLQIPLKNCKSVLGLPLLNSVRQKSNTATKEQTSKMQGKENLKPLAKCWSKKEPLRSSRKARANQKSKVSVPKHTIKAVQIIQSDEQQCF